MLFFINIFYETFPEILDISFWTNFAKKTYEKLTRFCFSKDALDNIRDDLQRAKEEKEADMRNLKSDMKQMKDERDQAVQEAKQETQNVS